MSAKNGKPAQSDRSAAYCRTSDPGQSTVPEQERWARGVAESHGWPLVAVVADEGLSGDDRERPGLLKLEEVFAQNFKAGCPVTRLLVPKTDRLSRSDTLDAFEVLARLRRLGLRYVVTTDRTIDLTSRLDRTLYALEQDHGNNPFLATNAERTLRHMADVAAAGFWIGRVPLGYRLEKAPGAHGAGRRRRSGRLFVSPETAPLVRELFERYAAGESTTDLARWLSARVKPPHARQWIPQTVRGVLMNDVYMGVRTFGGRARGKHVRLAAGGPVPQDPEKGEANLDGALIWRDESLVIVPPELFRRVQTRLATGRRRGYRRAAQPLPLSGLGRCGCCGGPLNVGYTGAGGNSPRGTRVRRLVCANRHRYGVEACPDGSTGCYHDPILGVVFELLADTLLRDGALERLTRLAEERAGEAVHQQEACRAALLRRAADLGAKLVRVQRRLAEVDSDMLEDCQAGIRQLRQERDDVQAELDALDARQADAAGLDPARVRAFWETCRQAYDLFHNAADYPPSLRPLLAELVEGFTLHWKRDKRRRPVPARVDVELPKWLTLLASSGRLTLKQGEELPIVISADV